MQINGVLKKIIPVKEFLDKFFSSYYYIATVGFIVFLCWIFKVSVVNFYLLFALVIIALLTQKDITGIIPPFVMGLFGYSGSILMGDIYIFLGVMTVPFLLSLGYFIYKNIHNLKRINGKMFYPFLAIVAVAALCGTGNFDSFKYTVYFMILGASLVVFLLYYFVSSCVNKPIDDYFAFTMVVAGTVVCFQVLSYYLMSDDILFSLQNKTLTAGWGVSNAMASVIIMALPFCLYFMKKSIISQTFSIILSFFFLITLLFTFSRGALLSMAIVIIPLFVYSVFKCKNKIAATATFVSVLLILIILLLVFKEQTKSVLSFFNYVGLNDRGRLELYREALNLFYRFPLMGGGFFSAEDETGFIMILFHNTVLQFMAAGGVFGFALLLYHTAVKYKILVSKRKNVFCAFCLFSALLGELYGMLDITFFAPQYLMIFVMTMISAEKSSLSSNSLLSENLISSPAVRL